MGARQSRGQQPKPDENTPLVQKPSAVEVDAHHEQEFFTAFRMNVLAALACFCVGVWVLTYFEGWTFLSALYVLSQIITTIGYGDFTVETSAAKLFMGLYAFSVLVILAYALTVILSGVMERREEVLRRHLRKLQATDSDGDGTVDVVDDFHARMQFGNLNKVIAYGTWFLVALTSVTLFYRFYEHCSCVGLKSEDRMSKCDDTSFETCAATGGAVKGFAEAFYMATITLTSVGFGDYQPRSPLGRLLSVVWMIVGVMITASFIGALSEYFFNQQRAAYLNAAEFMSTIHEKEFRKMDADNSGWLSRSEFLIYSLRKYGNVSEELLDQLSRAFDEIDTGNTNAVTLDMLKARQSNVKQKHKEKLKGARFTKDFSKAGSAFNMA
mmetsp:Transcript_69675/g.130012  ORF Transcript_69675/g.130012 Transcript_69675/m.130012 type:complete len:383 (-) Transcript_69675:70-1218(-)